MATYTRPGVYVEEYLNPLSNIATDPSVAGAAFVGVSSGGGPIGPTPVTSWNQYQALFGNIAQYNDDLSYAVYSFFSNGGTGCYVVRAINDTASVASLSLNGTQAEPSEVLTVAATAGGVWASDAASSSRVYVSVSPSVATDTTRFDLTIDVGTGSYLAAREQFIDLSMDPADGRYAIDIVNSPVVGSKYVVLTDENTPGAAFAGTMNPAEATKVPLTGGSDGAGDPDLVAATERLDAVDLNLVINVPGATAVDLTSILTWVIAGGRHFIVADVPRPGGGDSAGDSVSDQVAFADALPNTAYVAVYGPWLYAVDPGSKSGSTRLVAPGGAVIGQYLRTDASRGVFKAPAGVANSLAGVVAPFQIYNNTQQDALVTSAVNLIKPVPGSGICIMGARTQGQGYPDLYVPVRRLLISIKSSLSMITRFAIFENNSEDLWATVDDTVTTFLQQQFDLGAFKGTSYDQSFYVICDSTNNTQATIDAGVINIEVGVALQNPAEFVVIRLGQTTSGTTATDSLEA